MKSISRFMFAVALMLLPSLVSAQGFEGTMTMQMTIPQLGGSPIPMEIAMKGDKSVSTMSNPMAGEMKVYSDLKAMKTVMVMGKMGYEIDMNKKNPNAANADETQAPVATGQKKTINGYACELFTSKPKEGELEMWMTLDFPKEITSSIGRSFTGSMGGMRANKGAGENAFAGLILKGYAPVQINMKKDGETMATIEFVKYEKKSLSDALFVIPTDVNVQPMPDMQGGGMH
jgi:hypothetical protein